MILEVSLSMVVLAIAGIAGMSLTVSSTLLEAANQENERATAAAHELFERISAVPFEEVYARFNADPEDDPSGPGTSPGSSFNIQVREFLECPGSIASGVSSAAGQGGTTPYPSRPPMSSPAQGTGSGSAASAWLGVNVSLPVDAEGRLSELASSGFSGLPMDLNADGVIGEGDRSGDYRVLPVTVSIDWAGAAGARSLRFTRLITRRR